ncbi:hypothetical protein FNH09_08115 [Streptomyces adustus]|uniref:Uncharacterized protein n=1 Tax=Streptomyces adustus TaxID=1609272 RepID=A0A5N8V7X4_9ACTN|nr:hypothetical protein [Streptomyces adustus]MPY31267.1 hypothetical protein [Streptomyces adustus]
MSRARTVIPPIQGTPTVRPRRDPFDFSWRNGAAEPDLMLRDELQTALADIIPPVLVELRTNSQPLVIKEAARSKVVEETVQRACGKNYGTAVTAADQPWSVRKRLSIHVGLYQAADLTDGSRIAINGGFWGAREPVCPGPCRIGRGYALPATGNRMSTTEWISPLGLMRCGQSRR